MSFGMSTLHNGAGISELSLNKSFLGVDTYNWLFQNVTIFMGQEYSHISMDFSFAILPSVQKGPYLEVALISLYCIGSCWYIIFMIF